jgi:hypothetical protein
MARKSEIRLQAKAALDSLLAATKEPDEARASGHLRVALERLSEAAGVLPEGRSLQEVAADGEPPESGESSLREVLAYATGERRDNPLLDGDADLLARMGIDRDYLGG